MNQKELKQERDKLRKRIKCKKEQLKNKETYK